MLVSVLRSPIAQNSLKLNLCVCPQYFIYVLNKSNCFWGHTGDLSAHRSPWSYVLVSDILKVMLKSPDGKYLRSGVLLSALPSGRLHDTVKVLKYRARIPVTSKHHRRCVVASVPPTLKFINLFFFLTMYIIWVTDIEHDFQVQI